MKKLLFLILITILFSCEKPKEEKKQCWICVDQFNTGMPPLSKLITCDPVEASYQNSKKHYKDQGVWHNWTCKPEN
jgi:hypothetical protein